MKQPYVIVETWNGEGYSYENKITHIKYFEDDAAANNHCKTLAEEAAKVATESFFLLEAFGANELTGDQGGWQYSNNEDAGTYCFFRLLPDSYGIVIKTNVCHAILATKEEYEELFEEAKAQADPNDMDFEDTDTRIFIQAYEDEYDYQFEVISYDKIDRDDLEITEGGDGVETEIWRHPDANKLYKVGIEIKRDWDNMEQI